MKASGMTDSEIKKKHPDLFNEVEEGHCGGASESHCNEDSLSSKDLKENESKKLVCPKCGTHNDLGIKKCANCGHPYDDKFGEKKWKEVTSEGDLGEGKKKKKTDFDVGGQPQYRAKRSQKQIDKQADLTRKYNAAKTEKQKQKYRDMIDRSREKEGTNEGMIRLTSSQLSEIISETIEAQKLEMMLEKVEEIEEKKKRKKSGKSKKGLSKAVKKSLDKKADRRCLTRGSVYAEFRKGLAAYYSSGSRKGMSAHQWAHARVNSANPSKKWAVVKKRKKCPKKKK
jgi:ribosomal protein L37E